MCNFCKNVDFGAYRAETEQVGESIRARISTAGGSGRFPQKEQFNFCPVCGGDLRIRTKKMMDKIDVGAGLPRFLEED